MMNLVSFEMPHLRREERVHATTTTRTSIIPKDGSSRNTIFDGHLDLSLGMSMSSGGSGCEATGCGGANKANDVGSKCCIGKVGCMSGGVTTVTPANALSAEHGHVSDLKAGADWTSAFMPSPTGFMHPWSLAARQQKAATEQDRTLAAAAYVPSEACGIPLPSAEGLPPVHTSRRNLITAMHTVDGPKGATTSAGNEKKNSKGVVGIRPLLANMFAKVHMEGYAIARKINLRAHGSYDSLSRVLTKMTRNFFSPHSGAGNYHVYNLGLPPNNMIVANSCLGNEHYTMYTKAADCSSVNAEEEFCTSNKFIFLYEDFEGDRMLIGDVPWELFLASAKRLYIVRNPMLGDKGHDDYDKNDTTEKTTNN